MKKRTRTLGPLSVVLVLAWLVYGISALSLAPRDRRPDAPRDDRTEEWAIRRAEQLEARWAIEYTEHGLQTKTPIQLGFSRAFSERFTTARGQAEMNFQTGRVTVSVDNLEPLHEGAAYEVWLVEQVPGAFNTAAIDVGDYGDRIVNLGVLTATGSLVASVGRETLANMDVDMAVVMRVAPDRGPEFVIGGMQSIRFQMGRAASSTRNRSAVSFAAAGFGLPLAQAGFGLMPLPRLAAAPAQGGNSKKLNTLIAQGRDLFFSATFGGNGRTCGTCHRADNNLTIDIAFITNLLKTDPTDRLFVAELEPSRLPPFDAANPNQPAMEDPVMMEKRGLILVNNNGFGLDPDGLLLFPPVFRAPPSLFNLEFTAPYGLSDCCPNLQDFSAGAVVQHFTKTLHRSLGLDFTLPTATELKALEAFMLSNTSPANGNFKISGRNSLLSTSTDPRAIDTTRPEVRGRELFLSIGCTTCHLGTVFSGGIVNLNTGIEALERVATNTHTPTPTIDTGDGSGQFQIPQLFGLRKAHFFHSGLLGNNTVAPPNETLAFANLRDAVSFYGTPTFAQSPDHVIWLRDFLQGGSS